MLNALDIEHALHSMLSEEYRKDIPLLSREIHALIERRISDTDDIRMELKSILVPIIQELSGKQIKNERINISFGENNQFGDITIGDIAGRDIIKITITLPSPPPGVPFQVPSVVKHFVPRRKPSEQIKKRLLTEQTPDSPILVISAVHGMGGVGKTTLVAALSRELAIRQRFLDGVLWVRFGPNPQNPLGVLSGWIQQLGDYLFRPTVIESASAHVRSIIEEKAILIVLDDVWDIDHIRPFLVGGPRCQVLVTTREASIARELHAEQISLDAMTPDEATELIKNRLRRNLLGQDLMQARELAAIVGYLPLALELAAVQLQEGVLWGDLLHDLQTTIAHLEVLESAKDFQNEDENAARERSLRASLAISLRRLSKQRRQAFAQLGVLAKGAELAAEIGAFLWECTEKDARDTLHVLNDKALLTKGSQPEDDVEIFHMHDVLHDMARRILTGSPEVKSG